MDRRTFLELWNSSWDGDGWFTPWNKAVAGLTPEQAAWKPAPGRHSIWQNVNHVSFWREYGFATLDGRPKPSAADVEKGNFEEPGRPTVEAWNAARQRLEASHKRVGQIIADESQPLDRFQHHLAHDAYHLGQVMLVRGILGLPPVV